MTNPRFQWDLVGKYFFDTRIIDGLLMTLRLTFITLGIAFVLGAVLAVARTSKSAFLRMLSTLYVWFFRGTPLLVQLLFWYNVAALYPTFSFPVPFGPTLFEVDATTFISAFAAALIAFGLNQSAYMAEIIRSGMLAVDEGQRDAAYSLGFTTFQVLRRVVAPQAMRVIIPAVGNLTIGLLKYTSLVSVVALPDLLYSAQLIYAQTFETIPLLLVATIWYLIVVTLLSVTQFYIERYYARGASRNLPPTLWQTAAAQWNHLRGKLSGASS